MRKYIIMGVQGSGKGTQAGLLARDFDLVHISLGDIFRWHIRAHTKLAARVQRIVARGELVPDEIVEAVVKERLELHDWNHGFILDGFPRDEHQAEFFLERYDVDAVIQLAVPDDVVLERILSRRSCGQCGEDYNLRYRLPATPGICDVCGGPLAVREDDTPEAVQERLRAYHAQTAPVLEVLRRKERIVTVDASKPAQEVQAEIRDRLGLKKAEVEA
jgi:adenylate kinase